MGVSEKPPTLALPDSRSDDREDGRKGVVGRERGRRVVELERLVLLSAGGVVEEDIVVWFGKKSLCTTSSSTLNRWLFFQRDVCYSTGTLGSTSTHSIFNIEH